VLAIGRPTGIGTVVFQLDRGFFVSSLLLRSKFHPPHTHKRLYKTGDLARWLSDGTIEILGRLDNQVKIRGFRIELGEIESAIRQEPDVRDTAVVVDENTPGEKQLVAYVVKGPKSVLSSDEVRRFLKAKLPDYMVPAIFMFVDALPRTPNGKLDRRALPRPDQSQFDSRRYQAPRTEAEEIMVQIWTDVLKIERVGIYDNFFDLGGHSLLATRVISRARAAFHTDLSLRSFFEAPTVAEMVALVIKNQAQQLDEDYLQDMLVELERDEA
jgi:hypothetical protein